MKLADLFIKLGLRKDGFDKGLNDAKSKTNAFGNAVKKIGGMLAGAFAVDRLLSFGKELINLGGVAEGVRAAFERIGDNRTLRGLQEATRGTVSELDLMKRAVSANNLGIPISNLASLFEFATKRAQDTGESVDYLVNSIVTGIGRKSPLILDNLGISAIQLKEKLHGVGMETASVAEVAKAVGEIAADSMRESGDIIETNAIKVQNLSAMWQDVKLSIASNKAVIESVGDSLTKFQQMMYVWASDNATALEKWAISFEIFDKRAERLYNQVKRRDEEQARRDEAAMERRRMETELFNMFGRSVNNLTKEEMEAAKKAGEAQWKAYREAKKARVSYLGALKQVLSDTKAELATLMNTGGKWHGEDSAENFIKKVDELKSKIDQVSLKIADLTGTRRVKAEEMPKMESIGLSGDEFASVIPDTSQLDSLDSFREMLQDRLKNMIDAQTFAQMKSNWDEANNIMNDALGVMETAIEGHIVRVSEAIGEVLVTGDWGKFGEAILASIGNFMMTLGGLIVALGIHLQAAEASAATLNAPGIIAAGAAMIVAGAAIGTFASKGFKGGSSYSGASASNYNNAPQNNPLGDVRFVLEGDKLVGAIDNNRRRRGITQ